MIHEHLKSFYCWYWTSRVFVVWTDFYWKPSQTLFQGVVLLVYSGHKRSRNNYFIYLDGGIDLLQCTDSDRNLPLHLAIENGHLDLVQLCIEQASRSGINFSFSQTHIVTIKFYQQFWLWIALIRRWITSHRDCACN